jgi:hypothetical protein
MKLLAEMFDHPGKVLTIFLVLILGMIFGAVIRDEELGRRAIEVNAAKYTLNEKTGVIEFTWNTK